MKQQKPEERLEIAQMEAERAKKRFADTSGALQYRLKPQTLMNNAWEGVRDKGETIADEAMQAVKERPATVSGVIAGILLFLAREPLYRFIARLFGPRQDEGIVKTDLAHHDENFDLTAPKVDRLANEGVNA